MGILIKGSVNAPSDYKLESEIFLEFVNIRNKSTCTVCCTLLMSVDLRYFQKCK